MIDKVLLQSVVDEWLSDKEYFLTDLTISADDRILVEIDHKEGVWIEDCVKLSRFIESRFDREETDFELEVGSAGIGQPFKILHQYEIHKGENVDIVLKNGKKLTGTLVNVTPQNFILRITERVKLEGMKRPEIRERDIELNYDDVKATRLRIDFK